MAFRGRSQLTPSCLLLVAAGLTSTLLSPAFVPCPATASIANERTAVSLSQVATAAALSAVTTQPLPALAADDDEPDEGFDTRILAVLALPAFAISWALFNVWRVAFRQLQRMNNTGDGGIKRLGGIDGEYSAQGTEMLRVFAEKGEFVDGKQRKMR